MSTLPDSWWLYGAAKPPPEARELRAGPVTTMLDGIDLRYVRVGPVEVVRRIYVAVRDRNWDTIPGEYRITAIDQEDAGFEVRFEVAHKAKNLDFSWRGRILGAPDGQIRYELDGVADSDFRYNRIGFCVLHPYRECAGRPYEAETPQGTVSGHLPGLIGQQRFEDGHYIPLFPACSRLTIHLDGGVRARFQFEGDLFEMEDQRNWTDASLKTYCTPLSLGFPHQASAGQRIAQSVAVSVEGAPAEARPEDQAPEVRLSLGLAVAKDLPAIGFGLPSDGVPLSARELELARWLRPDHLRVDVHVAREYARDLEAAIEASQALGCPLELAVFVDEESAKELDELAELLRGRARVARFIVLDEAAREAQPSETTAPQLVELVRRHLQPLAPEAPFVGGTDMYFCELNRTRPQVAAMDGIAYTIIPQTHAFDDRSLAETLEAQGETVRSAQAFAEGRPIVVSPVTLKRRYNPVATEAEAEPAPGELPAPVDPRQMSLFGAAWTAGSVKYLAESGASSLTYYELAGWRGLMERETGSPLPERFPSAPGMVFPLYHVFADVAEWKAGRVASCASSRPLAVAALAIVTTNSVAADANECGGALHLLVANLTRERQRALIGPISASQVSVRSLDLSSVRAAALQPERFRRERRRLAVREGLVTLDLEPCATVRIDA